MNFKGYAMTFSTVGEKQYENIGRIWDYLSDAYGRENIKGLGFCWTDTSIDYCFAFKDDISEEEYESRLELINPQLKKPFRFISVELPDDSWVTVKGETDKLSELYGDVYSKGSLDYEIETFNDDGTCEIMVHYVNRDEAVLKKSHFEMRTAEFLAVIFDVLSILAIFNLVFFIYEVATSGIHPGFLGLVIPLTIVLWCAHCGFLVNRVVKRKAMARRIIEMRFSDAERVKKSEEYHVRKFVESMIEVTNNSTKYSNPM